MFAYLFPLASPSLPPSLSHPSRWSQEAGVLILIPPDMLCDLGQTTAFLNPGPLTYTEVAETLSGFVLLLEKRPED